MHPLNENGQPQFAEYPKTLYNGEMKAQPTGDPHPVSKVVASKAEEIAHSKKGWKATPPAPVWAQEQAKEE